MYLQSLQGDCDGFGDVLDAYNEVTPNINLGGPTNFAPLIQEAINKVKKRKQVNLRHNDVTSEPRKLMLKQSKMFTLFLDFSFTRTVTFKQHKIVNVT